MPKPVPDPPDYEPTPEVADLVARAHALSALPEGAHPELHEAAIRDLQYLWLDLHEEWSRAMARAQAAGVSHHRLTEVSGYKGRKASQRAVYRGRELLAQDAATT